MDEGSRIEVLFGGFDGIVSAVGVITPLLIIGSSTAAIVVAAIGLSINSAWSMGSGQYISATAKHMRLAVVMGLATLFFSLLPALPFVFGGSRAEDAAISGALIVGIGVLISELRPGARRPSYLLTFFVLGVGVLLAVAWGLVAPN